MTALRPFFSFYGSKWRLASKYPEPKHDTIIEPFAGSAGYSLHYPEKQVILIERDPVVAAIWRWLVSSATPDDLLSLPNLRTKGDRIDNYDLPQIVRWLMGFWVHQAEARPYNQVTTFGANGGCHDYRARCARQLPYIRHWVVIEGNYDDAPDIEATWFIDPPYQVEGKRYIYNADSINHDHLAAWCKSRQGQSIVCENAGADWLPFTEFATLRGPTLYGKSKVSKEVVWLNDMSQADLRLTA